VAHRVAAVSTDGIPDELRPTHQTDARSGDSERDDTQPAALQMLTTPEAGWAPNLISC
jgi:hypothetical protein